MAAFESKKKKSVKGERFKMHTHIETRELSAENVTKLIIFGNDGFVVERCVVELLAFLFKIYRKCGY